MSPVRPSHACIVIVLLLISNVGGGDDKKGQDEELEDDSSENKAEEKTPAKSDGENPAEDTKKPPQDTKQPPEDTKKPPEDTKKPPKDKITPPEDTKKPPSSSSTQEKKNPSKSSPPEEKENKPVSPKDDENNSPPPSHPSPPSSLPKEEKRNPAEEKKPSTDNKKSSSPKSATKEKSPPSNPSSEKQKTSKSSPPSDEKKSEDGTSNNPALQVGDLEGNWLLDILKMIDRKGMVTKLMTKDPFKDIPSDLEGKNDAEIMGYVDILFEERHLIQERFIFDMGLKLFVGVGTYEFQSHSLVLPVLNYLADNDVNLIAGIEDQWSEHQERLANFLLEYMKLKNIDPKTLTKSKFGIPVIKLEHKRGEMVTLPVWRTEEGAKLPAESKNISKSSKILLLNWWVEK